MRVFENKILRRISGPEREGSKEVLFAGPVLDKVLKWIVEKLGATVWSAFV